MIIMHMRAITATKPKQRVWGKLIVKIGTQILKDLGKIKKFFSVRLAAVYSTVNRRCRLFACFFVSDLLLFTACKHAALV